MTLSKTMKAEAHKIADEFAKGVISSTNALKNICKLVYESDPSNRTITIRFSLIKKIFKSYTKEKLFLAKIKPDEKITKDVIKKNEETRDNQQVMDLDEETVKQIMSYAHSPDIYKTFIYLLFISGRRTNELINSAFKNSKGRGNKKIIMMGMSKKRTQNEDECHFTPLVNKGAFFRAYHRFFKFIHCNSLNTFQRQLTKKVHALFPDKCYHPHSFRGMYALYAYKFRNPKKMKINTFIQDALCHGTVKSSLSYTQWNLDDIKSDIIKENHW